MISGSGFFVVGGTLGRDAPSYVARRADGELLQALREGSFCYLLTARQMGKSSLMVRAAARLRAEGSSVAVLDLTAIGQNLTSEQWYEGLAERLGAQLGLEDEVDGFWSEHGGLPPLMRWTGILRQVVLPRRPGRVVVFVDELDAVRSLPFSTDELFAGIRELYTRRSEDPELCRLSFCLLGVATPSDLIRDTRTTPFNIGRRIELDDFTIDEALPLAGGLGREEGVARALLGRVLHWTGGHPFLTQRLCQAVREDASVVGPADVDRLAGELFLSARARERDDNLVFVRDRIHRSDLDLAALLELYRRVRRGLRVPDDDTNPLVGVLRLSGIARSRGGALAVRNRIYAEVFDEAWVAASMPGAEVRRQKAAYRRGLARAASVAAAVVALVGGMAFVAVDRSRRAEEQRARAEKGEERYRQLLYAARMNVAYQTWNAGQGLLRVLDVLDGLRPEPGRPDLRGFEWYCLWGLTHRSLRTFGSVARSTVGRTVAFLPDGRTLALAGDDSRVHLVDLESGRVARRIGGLGRTAVGFDMSPDGKLLVCAGDDRTVRLWDVATGGEVLRIAGLPVQVHEPVFLSDGSAVAATQGQDIVIWDARRGEEVGRLVGHEAGVVKLAVSPDGTLFASTGADSTVRLWSVPLRRSLAVLRPGIGWTLGVTFSPDGRRFLAGTASGKVAICDVARREVVGFLEGHASHVFDICFSRDGKLIATASGDSTVRLWDAETGRELARLWDHTHGVEHVVFSPDGTRLATYGHEPAVKVWDVPRELHREPRALAFRRATAFVFAPGGARYALAVRGGDTELLDTATGSRLARLERHGDYVRAIAFSQDGRLVATTGEEGAIRVWDGATGRELRRLTGFSGVALSVVFLLDGKVLASGGSDAGLDSAGGDRTLRLWDVTTGTQIAELAREDSAVCTLAPSPDGALLASATNEGTITLWDVAARRKEKVLTGHRGAVWALAFSRDGAVLVSSSQDTTLRFWDVRTGKPVAVEVADAAIFMTFSPDGRRLVASGEGARLWDVTTRQELATLRGLAARVENAAFSPDGQVLYTGGRDGNVRAWVASSEAEVRAWEARAPADAYGR